MDDNVLNIKNLTKKYKQNIALNNISFDIKKGELVGLLGHNGAGKTTLIKCIVGLLKRNEGQILLFGKDIISEYSQVSGKIGLLLEPSFYDFMTAYENLKVFSMASKKTNIINEDIESYMISVGLKNALNKKVTQFSFGMKQRLGLVQALMSKPSFIILDEPFVGLDPNGIKLIKSKLQNLITEHKTTILFSSHQLLDIEDICQRIILLKNGQCVLDENTNNILGKKYYKIDIGKEVDENIMKDVFCKRNISFYQNTIKITPNTEYDLNNLIKLIVSKNIVIKNIEVCNDNLSKLFEN